MLSAFGRVFKTADLRRKLLFTLAMIVLYRVGTFIPAPGVSYGNVQQCLNANVTSGGVYDIVNLFQRWRTAAAFDLCPRRDAVHYRVHYHPAAARGHPAIPGAAR